MTTDKLEIPEGHKGGISGEGEHFDDTGVIGGCVIWDRGVRRVVLRDWWKKKPAEQK